jgi:hypothetical protein
MKYVKSGTRTFTTNQLSIEETITEVDDVIAIAQDIIKNITDVSGDTKKELDLVLNNLHQATGYLEHIRRKADVALKYVSDAVKEKEYL